MQKYFFLAAAVSVCLVTATGCGGKKDKEKTKPSSAVELPDDYKEYNLKDKGLEISIMAPPNAEIYNYTLVTNDGEQQAIAVQMESGSKDRLNISVTSQDFDALKKKAEDDMFRKFKSVITEGKNALLYDYTDKEQTGYGFFLLVEKGGKKYLIESDNMMSPITDKAKAELLFSMAQTVK